MHFCSHKQDLSENHVRQWELPTDLKNRTGSSIYCWETEANGGHFGVTTWGVQWRHSKENENSDVFYLKLTNEMCWLNTFLWRTEISNMAVCGHYNILWSPQNSLVIFTFKVNCRREHIGCILNLFRKPRNMICLQTPSFGWSFQDGCQLASKPPHHKRVARSSPIFQISGASCLNIIIIIIIIIHCNTFNHNFDT